MFSFENQTSCFHCLVVSMWTSSLPTGILLWRQPPFFPSPYLPCGSDEWCGVLLTEHYRPWWGLEHSIGTITLFSSGEQSSWKCEAVWFFFFFFAFVPFVWPHCDGGLKSVLVKDGFKIKACYYWSLHKNWLRNCLFFYKIIFFQFRFFFLS